MDWFAIYFAWKTYRLCLLKETVKVFFSLKKTLMMWFTMITYKMWYGNYSSKFFTKHWFLMGTFMCKMMYFSKNFIKNIYYFDGFAERMIVPENKFSILYKLFFLQAKNFLNIFGMKDIFKKSKIFFYVNSLQRKLTSNCNIV